MTSLTTDPVTAGRTPDFSLGERRKAIRRIGLVLFILAGCSMVATFLVLTEQTAIEPTDDFIRLALIVNSAVLLLLLLSTAAELGVIWLARRSGRAAARLHIRIVSLFSFLAVVPAVFVAIIASITLDRNLDRWFSARISQIIGNSESLAEAYVEEHGRVLQANMLAMAADIDRARQIYEFSPSQFDRIMLTLTTIRQMPVSFIVNGAGEVVLRTVVDATVTPLMPSPDSLAKAAEGEPVIFLPGDSGQVGGLMKLKAYDDFYLFVVRRLDPKVTEFFRLVQQDAQQYRDLERSRQSIQVANALLYIGVAMMLLLAAIWVGLGFSDRLVTPIRRLITAADQVSRGNLHVQVPVKEREGDFANLGAMFNTMTQQLRTQRDEILSASEQDNRRRRFTETVLSGVTASVIGIDSTGTVTIANPSALDLFETTEGDLIGTPLTNIVPELEDFLAAVLMSERPVPPKQVSIMRGQRTRILTARATGNVVRDPSATIVITLDDISDLVSAQRSAAWADVARRIAHEIKNPLTPIQLSAERIRRRYGKKIGEDTGVFDQCVDTIVRQVGDIGRMVDEFSSFARMPKPVMAERDLGAIVREAVFLQSVGFSDIDFETDIVETDLTGQFDERLIVQAISNLVKNAGEAVSGTRLSHGERGKVVVSVRKTGADFVIDVCDNGAGFPVEARENLLEPYMTTREKGTGLGLAIVRKIIEEHNGRIELLDAPSVAEGGQGALVRITLSPLPAGGTTSETSDPQGNDA
ncbi:MAG: PAS domain-containing sensor histidine kinase [Pseudomonadota bacterium]